MVHETRSWVRTVLPRDRFFASFTVSPRFVSSLVTVEMVNVVMSVEVSGRMNNVMMHGEVNDDTNTMMQIEG